MKLFSVIEKMARTIESFFEEEAIDNSLSIEISNLERRIYSQGKKVSRKYSEFLSNVDEEFFEVDKKSIENSVLRRIKSEEVLARFEELMGYIPIEVLISEQALPYDRNTLELEEFCSECPSDLFFEFKSFVLSVKKHLQNKKIARFLISLISKGKNFLQLLHTRIQITTSFLSYLDQVFTLKKVNSGFITDFNEFIFNLNTKSNVYGRKIFDTVPIAG